MSRRVDISAFKYAMISGPLGRHEIVALTNDIHAAHRVAYSQWHIVKTKELEAFKVNGYVGRDHAASSYIGYETVDKDTDIATLYVS